MRGFTEVKSHIYARIDKKFTQSQAYIGNALIGPGNSTILKNNDVICLDSPKLQAFQFKILSLETGSARSRKNSHSDVSEINVMKPGKRIRRKKTDDDFLYS